MLSFYLQLFGWLVLPAMLGCALAYGGNSERIGALLIFGGSLASFLVVASPQARFRSIESPMFVADALVLIAFVYLSLKTKRFWPIWATSFHSIVVLTHLADALAPHTLPRAYGILQGFWVYPMTVVLLLGVYGHRQAIKRGAVSLNS